jgi:hypothetical protein
MLTEKQYISIHDAATLVGSSFEYLLQEIQSHQLEASVSLQNLLAWKAGRVSTTSIQTLDASAKMDKQTISKKQKKLNTILLNSSDLLPFASWKPIPSFQHKWPDGFIQNCKIAYQSEVVVNGKKRVIVVGFTERAVADMNDRALAFVFYQSPPKQRPLVQFTGNGNLGTASTCASIIKLQGGSVQLRSDDIIPEEYQKMPRGIYSDNVVGLGASKSVAVIAELDAKSLKTISKIPDQCSVAMENALTIMGTHGVIRATYKSIF